MHELDVAGYVGMSVTYKHTYQDTDGLLLNKAESLCKTSMPVSRGKGPNSMPPRRKAIYT